MLANFQLSEHFSYREATVSATATDKAIENAPNPEQLKAMEFTASKMEIVRNVLQDRPLYITSWFRSWALNKAIGGAQKSQHSNGEAVDFKCPGFGNPRQICLELMKHKDKIGYDQLILEPTWVHISFIANRQPRGNELTLIGKGQYGVGIK